MQKSCSQSNKARLQDFCDFYGSSLLVFCPEALAVGKRIAIHVVFHRVVWEFGGMLVGKQVVRRVLVPFGIRGGQIAIILVDSYSIA